MDIATLTWMTEHLQGHGEVLRNAFEFINVPLLEMKKKIP